MTEGRPYKKARTVDETVGELVSCAGRQFDVEVVDAFVAVLREDGLLTEDQEGTFKRRLHSFAGATTRG